MPHDLIVHSHEPLNAEPPLALLRAAFTTPQSSFYIRCHGAVPELDEARHRLRVGGLVGTPLDLSVAGLQSRFAPRTVAAVLQCAGNRRADLQQVAPTTGDAWQGGAIGHADWTGAALRDVLLAAGASTGPGLHVVLSGEDTMEVKGAPVRYEVSVAMEKAMDGDVLLAWAMNGEALAPEHGHPLRAVVPGYAGVRSAKWLSAVTVQGAPAASPVQQRDYKLLPPHMTAADAGQDANWLPGVPINEMPLNAVICEPAPGARLPSGPSPVRGYAVASGRQVVRVDVSSDGGRHWVQAALEQGSGRWDWVFWSATLELRPGAHDLAVRAWDSAGQTMPAQPGDTWNIKGYLCAAWHRVPVTAA